MVRNFDAPQVEPLPMWEQGWFLTLVRYVLAFLGVIVVLLMGVRPLVKALKREPGEAAAAPAAAAIPADPQALADVAAARVKDPLTGAVDAALLSRQVGLAQQVVAEKPDSAVQALRDMLRVPEEAAS
jgi:flagellar M-ring protein FliF